MKLNTIKDLVKHCGMVQLTNKGQSLRIRENKNTRGEYFATVRSNNARNKETSYHLNDEASVVELINSLWGE
jgi:hypothetical protein